MKAQIEEAEKQAAEKDAPKEPEFVTYTVKKGDTLSGLAKRYGVTIDEIKANNKIKGNNIMLGQKLRIPKK